MPEIPPPGAAGAVGSSLPPGEGRESEPSAGALARQPWVVGLTAVPGRSEEPKTVLFRALSTQPEAMPRVWERVGRAASVGAVGAVGAAGSMTAPTGVVTGGAVTGGGVSTGGVTGGVSTGGVTGGVSTGGGGVSTGGT